MEKVRNLLRKYLWLSYHENSKDTNPYSQHKRLTLIWDSSLNKILIWQTQSVSHPPIHTLECPHMWCRARVLSCRFLSRPWTSSLWARNMWSSIGMPWRKNSSRNWRPNFRIAPRLDLPSNAWKITVQKKIYTYIQTFIHKYIYIYIFIHIHKYIYDMTCCVHWDMTCCVHLKVKGNRFSFPWLVGTCRTNQGKWRGQMPTQPENAPFNNFFLFSNVLGVHTPEMSNSIELLCCWWLIWPIQNDAKGKAEKWRKPWHMRTHPSAQRELSNEYQYDRV